MKKIMTMAALLTMALAANAQNPAGLKKVLSCKSYSEAAAAVQAEVGGMISEEKAKAYNKLVDLALSENKKAEEETLKAQMAKDDATLAAQKAIQAESAYNAFLAALECDKYDQEPNAKGKVAPKFQKNAARIQTVRGGLVNGGLDSYNSKNYADAQKYFGAFVDSRVNPFFAKNDYSAEKDFGQLAYYAALAAYFNKDYKTAGQYADVSLASGQEDAVNDGITIKIGALELQAKEGAIDTTAFINEVKAVYDKFPQNETAFGKLVGLYDESKNTAAAQQLLNARLAQNPNDAMSNAYLGQFAQAENKLDEAIGYYQKAIAAKPDFLHVKLNIGVCYLNKAGQAIDSNADARGNIKPEAKEGIIADLNKAKTILEEVKAADPDRSQVNWSYPLERVNYALENIQ